MCKPAKYEFRHNVKFHTNDEKAKFKTFSKHIKMPRASYSEEEEIITINLIFCHDKVLRMLMNHHPNIEYILRFQGAMEAWT